VEYPFNLSQGSIKFVSTSVRIREENYKQPEHVERKVTEPSLLQKRTKKTPQREKRGGGDHSRDELLLRQDIGPGVLDPKMGGKKKKEGKGCGGHDSKRKRGVEGKGAASSTEQVNKLQLGEKKASTMALRGSLLTNKYAGVRNEN